MQQENEPQPEEQMTRPRERVLFWDRRTVAGGQEVYELEVSTLDFPERLLFLEHVFDGAARKSSSQVIASSPTRLFISDDLGRSWRSIVNPLTEQFLKCFTLRSGRHLLQGEGGGGVHLFDPAWSYLGRRQAGQHSWHGTWSVDQSSTGVVMFAEYGDAGDVWRVQRSTDDGESWSVAFEVAGNRALPNQGDIRHFHTCQADPFEPNVWWLSSGDGGTQNRLWTSKDDGLTWQEVVLDVSALPGVPERRRHNVKRHTAELFTPTFTYWPTDDNLGERARLVRMHRHGEPSEALTILTTLSQNEVRNLIELGPSEMVVISEAKHDPVHAQAFCLNADGVVLARFDLPNTDGSPSGFCRSRSSKAAIDDVFFSFSDGKLLERGSQFLKWRVSRAERDAGERSRLALKERTDALRQAHGASDREVALLSRRYAAHFQCNMCSESLASLFEQQDYGAYEGVLEPTRFKEAACYEYTCPHCDSRIRQRTARLVLEHQIRNRRGRVLAVSEAGRQIRWFKERYDSVVHVALHGDFGDPNILTNTDVTCMPHVPTGTFSLYWACCVLDYIPNLEAAAREAYRVLTPGGEFAFFIMPYRLSEDNTTCVLKHRNALAHEKYAQQGASETGIPDCRFGVRHVLQVFHDAGLATRRVFLFDQLSRTHQAWFIATKPAARSLQPSS